MHLNTDDVAVWHQENGRPYTRYGYAKPFKKLKQELDMPEDFHWHDLRHTYATLMAKHDVNIRELATVLGHAKAEFTMQMYVVSEQPVYELLSPYDRLIGIGFSLYGTMPDAGKTEGGSRSWGIYKRVGPVHTRVSQPKSPLHKTGKYRIMMQSRMCEK